MNRERKVKVLTIIYALDMGGAENMAYELIKNIDTNKFDTPVLCYGPKMHTVLEEKMSSVADLDILGMRGKISFKQIFNVLKKISRYEPDIVHAHMGGVSFGVLWCLLHNKPIVITVHTKPETSFSKTNEKLVRLAIRRKLAFIVAVSEENLKYVKEYFHLQDDQCCFINNGIDLGRFYRKSHDKFTYINVARQDDNKNQEAIIQCFYRIHREDPNTFLYLIGDGPNHEKLQKRIIELDLDNDVALPGIINSPETVYALSDAYVQSSHREAMPLSVLEGMGAGLPVISTKVGGLEDVVIGNGYLVEDNNINELEQAMRLVKNVGTEEREKMGKQSLIIVKEYSSEKMAARYQFVYNTLVR